MQKSNTYIKAAVALSGFAFTASAFAAGFQISEVSPTIQATALADAATATGDISGMAFNPATLATVDGTQIYVAGSLIIPSVGYSNAHSTLAVDDFLGPPLTVNSPGTITNENNISSPALVPSLYMGTDLPGISGMKIGLGIDAPWGLSTSYDPNWVGQYNAIDSSIKTLNIFPTLAYQVTSKLSIGGAVNFERISANYSNNTFQQIDVDSYDLANIRGSSILSGSAWSTGYMLGAIYQMTPTTTIGADYHSTVRQTIDGVATINTSCSGVDFFGVNTCTIANDSIHFPNGNYNGTVVLKLPAVVNLGVSQKVTDKLTLMAGAQWTQWSSIPSISADIEGVGTDSSTLNYKNAWLYSLGASYALTDRWTLMGGLAYDETPTVNQYRDARIPDTNRKWITTGFKYAATKNFNVFATYEHIFMNNQSVNSTEPGVDSSAPATVSANYSGYANILAAGLNYKF